MSSDTILLEFDGPVAIMTNNRPEKHNAANDEMDTRLWEVLAELHERDGVRAVVWRGNGKSFSSGIGWSALRATARCADDAPSHHSAGNSRRGSCERHRACTRMPAAPRHRRDSGSGGRGSRDRAATAPPA